MSNVIRRGFLSLCLTTVALAAIPGIAEPVVTAVPWKRPIKNGRIQKYCLGMGTGRLIEPGEVVTLETISNVTFKPDRLLISNVGFNILHLDRSGLAIVGEGEVASDLFVSTPYSIHPNVEFGILNPMEKIVIAAVNRSKESKDFRVAIIGNAMTWEEEEENV